MKKLFWLIVFVWLLPLLREWWKVFLIYPYRVCGITVIVLTCILLIWQLWFTKTEIKGPKYRIEVTKFWLPQSYNATINQYTSYEYRYVIMSNENIIKTYDNVEEAYKQLEFLNNNI